MENAPNLDKNLPFKFDLKMSKETRVTKNIKKSICRFSILKLLYRF